MAQIQPVQSWQNGEEKFATVFNLSISYDNLLNNATFQYQLCEEVVQPTPTPSPLPMTNSLVSGYLSISGQDYADWDASPNANQWAYEWVATKLNLVLVTE